MLKKTVLFFFLACLAACSSIEKEKQESHEAGTADPWKADTTLAFSGVWVNESYVDAIRETRSPRAAQEAGPNRESFIVIPDRTLKVTWMVYGFHEGGATAAVLKKGAVYQLYDVNSREYMWDIDLLAKDRIRIGKAVFRKVSCPLDKDNSPRILEELLFSGKYRTPGRAKVEFLNTGEVQGLEGVSRYYPLIDYNDAGMQVDQLGLGNSKDDARYYGFRFRKDTLCVYDLDCVEYDTAGERCGVVDYGKLRYSLVKEQAGN